MAVWFFVTLCATVITFILPESYKATARIKIERETWPVDHGAPSQGSSYSPAYDPYFIQTEFEVLQSELILAPVIDRLKLDERWAKRYTGGTKLTPAQARLILRTHLEFRPVRNTSLIEITAWSERPGEAADIANAIAEEFRGYRNRQHDMLVDQSHGALQSMIKDQEAKIAEAQAALDDLRMKLHISQEQARQPMDSRIRSAELRPYWTKRLELEDLLRYRSELSQKLLSQEQESRLSRMSLVEIVDRAIPPFRPARPNKPLNIVLGMLAGAILGLFAGVATYVVSRLRQRPAGADLVKPARIEDGR